MSTPIGQPRLIRPGDVDFTGVIRPPASPSFHLPGRFCADGRSVKLRAGHRSNPQSKVTKEYEFPSAKAAKYASVQELGPTPAQGHELAPKELEAVRLGGEGQPSIGTQLPEGLPCLDDSPRSPSHHMGIRH